MTTHTPAIDVSHDQPPLPNQHFSPWLRGQAALFISQISAILGFVLFVATLIYYVSNLDKHYKLLEPSTVRLIVDYAHIIFMAVFIAVLIQVRDDNERGSYRVKLVHERVFGKHKGKYADAVEISFDDALKKSQEQLKQFKRRFLWFWIGMLFLYVCFACQHSYKLATSETEEKSGHSRKVSFSAVIKSPDNREDHFSVEGSFSTTDEAKTPKPESNPLESGQSKSNSDKLNGHPLFKVGDFKNLAGLAVKLRDAGDPLSQYLREQFSPDTKRQLDEYKDASLPLSESLQSALINELNKLLGDSYLFDEQRFSQVFKTEQTLRLIKQKSQWKGLVLLNRLLLEEAYPHEIAKHLLNLAETIKKLAFPFIVFFFNNLTLLFVFWCFLVLYIPWHEMKDRYYKYRNGSFFVFVVLTLLFPALVTFNVGAYTAARWDAYVAIFDALSGVLNAIALALLIARLDSKLIGLPSWLISILYSYAAVQPLFMVFELRSEVLERIATSVLIFVFVSKIYFFLIIIYAMQTGKMLNYLFCFPILRQRAKASEPQSTPLAYEGEATQTPPVSDNESPEGRVIRLLALCDKYLCELLGAPCIKNLRQYLSGLLSSDHSLKISLWLGSITIGCFFVYLVFASLGLNETGDVQNGILEVVFDCVQLLFILLVIGILFLLLGESPSEGRRALAMAEGIFEGALKPGYPMEVGEKQLKKFKANFLYFWFVTFLLYVVFLLDHLDLRFYLDNTGSVLLTSKPTGSVLLASNLLEPTLPGGAPLLPAPIVLMLEKLSYPFLKFSLATANSLFIFWCFVILRSPALDERAEVRKKLLARQRVWINYSGFVVFLLIASYPLLLFMMGVTEPLDSDEMESYATVFNGVTGTLSAIVLALLIARMDSKFFGLTSWLIGLLFAYASIQPLFVAFALNDTVLKMVQTSVLAAALGLKICFFLIVAHSLQRGRVLNYLVCFPFLKERVDSIFENQFEIRLASAGADSFTFSILKKNELRYSTPKKFKSRQECDSFVHDLRERMQARDSYLQPREESGTYWIELRSDAWEMICESIPLRSEEEAHDLIRESIDKIPYCKYNRT